MIDRLADDVGERARRSGRQAPLGTIHFPAQRLHRRRDADAALNNDADDGVTTTHVAGGAIRSECRRTA
jgi:hypothetical protein